MSGAGIFPIWLIAGLGLGAIRGALLAGEGAALGAAGVALGAAAAARQWNDELERLRACRETEVLHQLILAEVTARNARIAALHELAATGAGQQGTRWLAAVPEPLQAGVTATAELVAWCERTDAALAAVETALADQLTADMAAVLAARHQRAAARLVHATEELGRSDPGAAPPSDAQIERSLVRVLARLRSDTAAEDRRNVAAAAARVLEALTPGDARTCLEEVRLRVQRANERATARQAETIDAARMLHASGDGTGAARVRTELTEVVQGRRRLDDKLRERAAAAVAATDAEADHRYIADTVVATLAELGYTVEEGFQTLSVDDGVVRIRHADSDEHAVHLLVDAESGRLHTALVRTAPGATPAAEHEDDVASERAWCDALESTRERLAAAAGVSTAVEQLAPLGSRVMPQVGRSASSDQAARRSRVRRQERRRP
jgi:hypothetical protein